jgi:hypothetical protein
MISKPATAAIVAPCATAANAGDVMIVGLEDELSGREVPYWTAIPEESCQTILSKLEAAIRKGQKF